MRHARWMERDERLQDAPPLRAWQYTGRDLRIGDPDWVAETTEPVCALMFGAAAVGMTVHTARGSQRAKVGDWIVQAAGEIYLLSNIAYQALTSTLETKS